VFDALQEGDGQWVSLDSEIIMKNGEPIGTQTPTGHYVLLDTRFEPPPGITKFSFNRFRNVHVMP